MTSRPLPSGWTLKVTEFGRAMAEQSFRIPPVRPKRSSGETAVKLCRFCRCDPAVTVIDVCGVCEGLMGPPDAA